MQKNSGEIFGGSYWYFPELEDGATLDPIVPGEVDAITLLDAGYTVKEVLDLPEGDGQLIPAPAEPSPSYSAKAIQQVLSGRL